MITINNLLKQFGETKAVDIDNYVINQGDMLGLVGNNGAGKTTLFRLILDLLQADNGNVTIDDIDVSKSEDWKKTTGEFIDDGFLIDYLTPEEYFYFIGKVYGLSKQEIDERLQPFEHFMNGEVIGQKKYIRNYSAGNKQKIGIISGSHTFRRRGCKCCRRGGTKRSTCCGGRNNSRRRNSSCCRRDSSSRLSIIHSDK